MNERVLITGAARRVGAAIARSLHGSGMKIILHYRQSRSEAEALCQELNAIRAGSAAVIQADLLSAAQIADAIEEASAVWDGLDVLINNASAFYATPVESVTEAQWDDLLGSNLKAPFFLAQAALPYLKQQNGSIINIVDIHAERPLKGFPVYSIAKSALAALTRALAKELGPEVRVNGIAPGAILWPENEPSSDEKEAIIARVALRRTGRPEDIARAVKFLIRDADYITGQLLAVDGGRTLFS